MRTKPLVHPQVALGLPVCILWLPSLLGYGGLAPVALAAVIALAGCALLHAWPTPSSSPRWPSVVLGCIEVIIAGTVGASIAPMLNHLGTVTAMCIGAGIWVAGLTLFRVAIHPLLLTALPLFLALLGMLYAITTLGMGWTLLEPHWHTWSSWLGQSVTVGLLLGASCGWAGTRDVPAPVDRVWTGFGVLLLTTLMCCVLMASEWEASVPSVRLFVLPLIGLVGATSAATVALQASANHWMFWTGALFTGWFAGPGFISVPFWWSLLLPVLVIAGMFVMMNHSLAGRSVTGLVGLAVVAALWPGAPGSAVDASIVGIAVVLVFWIVASRAALGRHE